MNDLREVRIALLKEMEELREYLFTHIRPKYPDGICSNVGESYAQKCSLLPEGSKAASALAIMNELSDTFGRLGLDRSYPIPEYYYYLNRGKLWVGHQRVARKLLIDQCISNLTNLLKE